MVKELVQKIVALIKKYSYICKVKILIFCIMNNTKCFLSMMCLMAIAMNAQRCAVVGFKAGAKV